jgi:hypothetical protein
MLNWVIDFISGMFLFATLAMANLLEQLTLGDLLDELREDVFPAGLKDVYVPRY